MNEMKKKIREALNISQLDKISKETKEEIIEKLFIYHEELLFQNEELNRINKEITHLKVRFQKLFKEAPIGYVFLDDHFKIVEINDYMIDQIKVQLKNQKISDFIHPDSQDDLYKHQRRQVKSVEDQMSYLMIEVDGQVKHFKFISSAFYIDGNRYFQGAFIDETSEVKKSEKIQKLSYEDALTDVYNRRFFNEELRRLDVRRNLPLGLIIADINGLKLINDSFGHQVGDEFLIKTAEILKEQLRDDEIIARLGGDEFAVLMPKVNHYNINKILNRISLAFQSIKINDIPFSVALGYGIKNQESNSLQDIFKKAEDMMYQNKMLMKSNYHRNAIQGIMATLHEKHPREEEHSSRVQYYMSLFTKSDYFNTKDKALLETSGLLHDIGKIALDYSILEKEGKLTIDEYNIVKKHPEVGYRILKSAGVNQDILDGVLYHHESYDGTGYPMGLQGKKIPLLARVLTICDAYDAMLSNRPYRKALSSERALNELKECAGTQFDPNLVVFFIKIIESA